MTQAEEDEDFRRHYANALKEGDYEHIARRLSERLRLMDLRAKAANKRADNLELENLKLRRERDEYKIAYHDLVKGG